MLNCPSFLVYNSVHLDFSDHHHGQATEEFDFPPKLARATPFAFEPNIVKQSISKLVKLRIGCCQYTLEFRFSLLYTS